MKIVRCMLLGLAAFIVAIAPFFLSASACSHLANETEVPDCLK